MLDPRRDLSLKLLSALGFAALAACAQPLGPREHPLVGRIWDVRAARFVTADELFDRAARARHVILGETHDNPEHHRLQRVVLDALAARGEKRVLAMEQFDSEYQAAIDAARARSSDAEAIADAGHFERRGWNWPLYRPLVQFALERGWPLVAANLSRADARAIVTDAARANGAGHARRDRGVPLYVGEADVLSVAFIEVEPDRSKPQDYADGASFDYLWFSTRAAREDPCAANRLRMGRVELVTRVTRAALPLRLSRELAERTGLEPATPGVTGRYSNQLNYRSALLVGAERVELPTSAL